MYLSNCNTLQSESAVEEYASANFTLEVARLVSPASPSPMLPGVVEEEDGLTDGQIVGIVVGASAGFVILAGLLLLMVCCW